MILLMIYFCSMYNQDPTAKANIQSIFLGIIISIHVISHFVFVCEILYARRTESEQDRIDQLLPEHYQVRTENSYNTTNPKSTLQTENNDLEEQSSSSSSNGSDDEGSGKQWYVELQC